MPSIKPELRSLVTSDGAVILDARQNVVVSINPVGAYIWGKLQEGKQLDNIVFDLIQDTGADAVTVERDVSDFIEDLTARHLLIAPQSY